MGGQQEGKRRQTPGSVVVLHTGVGALLEDQPANMTIWKVFTRRYTVRQLAFCA